MNYEEAQALAKNAFAQEIHVLHKPYVDITGDLIAGMLLSQIMYWCSPDRNGKIRLRVQHKGFLWLAKTREDWFEELRISPKQYDRAIKILKEKDLVATELFRFNGSPTIHIRPNLDVCNRLFDEWIENKAQEIMEKEVAKQEDITFLPKGENPNTPKVNMEVPEEGRTLTETTTLTTEEEYKNKNNKECYSSNSTIDEGKVGKWEWKSDKSYIDYIEKVLPKMIKEIASNYGKQSDVAYNHFLDIVTTYFKYYRTYNNKYHPWYRKDTLEECIQALFNHFNDLDAIEVCGYIDVFFRHEKLRNKPLKVFVDEDILEKLDLEMM